MGSNCLTIWLGEHRVEGKTVARIGRRGIDLVAEIVDIGTLTVSTDGSHVHFEPTGGRVVPTKLKEGLLDALVRHARGKVTLHGGAVSAGRYAVAFVGPSGSGKSTLAAALCAATDVDMVADDTVAVEPSVGAPKGSIHVVPSQATAWLLPSARLALSLGREGPSGKLAVPLRAAIGTPTLIAVLGLVFDSDASEPTLERVRGHEAFSILSESAIRFVVDSPQVQLNEFDQLERLIAGCSVYRLRRCRNLEKLSASVQLVHRLLASAAPEVVG